MFLVYFKGGMLMEILVQSFPYRCPYCNNEIIYDPEKLTEGENEITCPICNKKFIRIFNMDQIRLLKQKAFSSSHEEAK